MKAAKIITRMAEEAREVEEHILAGELFTVAGAMREGRVSHAIELLSRYIEPMKQLQQYSAVYETRRAAGRYIIIYRTALEIIKEEAQP